MPLYLVATPIGNLDDITFRAVETLRKAELILAEDTRRTRGLLTHFGIEGKRVEAYHAHNEHHRTAWVITQLRENVETALVTDAGMPSIADPGFFLVREALAVGIEPIIVPGVSAVTFAVAACGFPVNRFRFMNFCPVKSGQRNSFLTEALESPDTAVFYETPHRIAKVLAALAELAPERPIAIIREATKLHEEILRGPAGELAQTLKDRVWKGEFTVVISSLSKKSRRDTEDIDED